MNLCGALKNTELRERIVRLAGQAGWHLWISHDPALLRPMLTALTPAPDAILCDDESLFDQLPHRGEARILLASASDGESSRELLFVVDPDASDDAMVKNLCDCVNATRLKQRFQEGERSEPITRLPRHQEVIKGLADLRGQAAALLVVHVDHAAHLYGNLDPVSKTDLLHALANRLKGAIPADATLGFYDAGCFIVTLANPDPEALAGIANHLRTTVGGPLACGHVEGVGSGEIHLTVSIGYNHVARYDEFEVLWHGAWQAVNRAAARGNRVEGGNLAPISSGLPDALDREEFSLVLQGQWRAERLRGVEALLRWQGMEVGQLAPSHFIPIAEQEGHMTRIGDWVLEHASRVAATWLEHLLQPLLLCVNVSPQQFVNGSITNQIVRLKKERWLDPAMLELELPHESMLELVDRHRDQLFHLRDLGVRFAIDNLGKTLIDSDKLLRCPVDTLKIDRSLTAKIESHAASRDLITEIAAIGERFQLRVVAVGVEDGVQLDFLEGLGNLDIQGYLMSPPVPISEFHQLLSDLPEEHIPEAVLQER